MILSFQFCQRLCMVNQRNIISNTCFVFHAKQIPDLKLHNSTNKCPTGPNPRKITTHCTPRTYRDIIFIHKWWIFVDFITGLVYEIKSYKYLRHLLKVGYETLFFFLVIDEFKSPGNRLLKPTHENECPPI